MKKLIGLLALIAALTVKIYPGDKVNVLLSCAPGILRIIYPPTGSPYALIDTGQGEPRRVDFPRAVIVAKEIERTK